MSNPFNCPAHIYDKIEQSDVLDLFNDMPILYAVKEIGPQRCQWLQEPPKATGQGTSNTLTYWALDGKRATAGQIIKAQRTENGGASLTVGRVELERGSPPVIHGTSLAETRGQVEDGLAPSFRGNGA